MKATWQHRHTSKTTGALNRTRSPEEEGEGEESGGIRVPSRRRCSTLVESEVIRWKILSLSSSLASENQTEADQSSSALAAEVAAAAQRSHIISLSGGATGDQCAGAGAALSAALPTIRPLEYRPAGSGIDSSERPISQLPRKFTKPLHDCGAGLRPVTRLSYADVSIQTCCRNVGVPATRRRGVSAPAETERRVFLLWFSAASV